MSRGEGIKPINKLFEKYTKTLKAPQGHIIDSFCDVVQDVLGIEVKKNTITFNTYSKTLTLSMSGVVKTELLLHKTEILNHLKGRLGPQNAPKEII